MKKKFKKVTGKIEKPTEKNYGNTLVLLGSIFLQTSIFSLTLLIAYYFWDAPNASLVIGTSWPLLIMTFFILSVIHNLIVWNSKSNHRWIISIVFFLLISIFLFYPSWSFLLMMGISTITVLIPLLLKSQNRFNKFWPPHNRP